MADVWYTIPSAKPDGGTVKLWKAKGYRVAVFRDLGAPALPEADFVVTGEYRGYASAVNTLIRRILHADPKVDWFVTGGDDVHPDPNHTPDEIARQCSKHFTIRPDLAWKDGVSIDKRVHAWELGAVTVDTLGVMQPTGDVWMVDETGKGAAERVCCSPWIGREFCQRSYKGLGPIWPGWYHYYEDEELQEVAIKLGILWQRKDLSHFHDHWMRNGGQRPKYLNEAKLDWNRAKALFQERKANGFPGHELLPVEVAV